MRSFPAIALLLLPLLLPSQAVGVPGGGVNAASTGSGKVAVKVYVFVRHDCPVSNRYAPEIQRLQAEFASRGVQFVLVYPDKDETAEQIAENLHDYYGHGGYRIATQRDPDRVLVSRAHVTITPEAAVFDHGKLLYHGRIDDWVVAFGKTRAAATTHELQDAIVAALAGKAPAVAYAPAIGCYLSDVQ